jgi:hypothetical protein
MRWIEGLDMSSRRDRKRPLGETWHASGGAGLQPCHVRANDRVERRLSACTTVDGELS